MAYFQRRYPLRGLGEFDTELDPFSRTTYDPRGPVDLGPEMPHFISDQLSTRSRKGLQPKRTVKLGRAVKCKVTVLKTPQGKTMRRKLCWDKQGHLVSNSAAGSRGGKGSGRKRRVKCKLKCPKGSSPKCKGGWRKGVKGGAQVCKKWVCSRRKKS